MEFGQIHHIEYYVQNLSRSNDFWNWFAPELGYKEFQKWGDGISYVHKNGTYLVFVQVIDKFLSANNTRQGNGLNHLAFMGGSLKELDMIQSKLEEKKIKILKRDGDYLCFEDPNEFAIEIYAKEK